MVSVLYYCQGQTREDCCCFHFGSEAKDREVTGWQNRNPSPGPPTPKPTRVSTPPRCLWVFVRPEPAFSWSQRAPQTGRISPTSASGQLLVRKIRSSHPEVLLTVSPAQWRRPSACAVPCQGTLFRMRTG